MAEHLFFSLGRSAVDASPHDFYMALSYTVRDRLMTRHLASKDLLRYARGGRTPTVEMQSQSQGCRRR